MPRPSTRRTLPLDPGLVQALADAMPVGDGQQPRVIYGWPGRGEYLRKVVAEYPNGWRMTVHLNKLGKVTSTSAEFKITTEIRGKSGTIVVDEAASL